MQMNTDQDEWLGAIWKEFAQTVFTKSGHLSSLLPAESKGFIFLSDIITVAAVGSAGVGVGGWDVKCSHHRRFNGFIECLRATVPTHVVSIKQAFKFAHGVGAIRVLTCVCLYGQTSWHLKTFFTA